MNLGRRILGTIFFTTAALQPIRSGAPFDEIQYAFTFQCLIIFGGLLGSHPHSYPLSQRCDVALSPYEPRTVSSLAVGEPGPFRYLTPNDNSTT